MVIDMSEFVSSPVEGISLIKMTRGFWVSGFPFIDFSISQFLNISISQFLSLSVSQFLGFRASRIFFSRHFVVQSCFIILLKNTCIGWGGY